MPKQREKIRHTALQIPQIVEVEDERKHSLESNQLKAQLQRLPFNQIAKERYNFGISPLKPKLYGEVTAKPPPLPVQTAPLPPIVKNAIQKNFILSLPPQKKETLTIIQEESPAKNQNPEVRDRDSEVSILSLVNFNSIHDSVNTLDGVSQRSPHGLIKIEDQDEVVAQEFD
jgi:hypothetical protein